MSETEKKQEAMTRDAAEAKLREWGDLLEVDTDREFFTDAVQQLALPVKKGRLDFDPEAGTFTYRLIKPIVHANSAKELITISEGKFGGNKVVDRFKESHRVEQSGALLARRTGLAIAEVEELSDRDVRNINAVILGFFG